VLGGLLETPHLHMSFLGERLRWPGMSEDHTLISIVVDDAAIPSRAAALPGSSDRRYLASDCQSEWATRARRSLKFCEMQTNLIASARRASQGTLDH